MRAIFHALGTMPRLRHLKVQQLFGIGWNTPIFSSIISDSARFTLITHLEVNLENESCVELVCSFASQLTCLVLNVDCKDLLVRCLNEPHLSALLTLTMNFDPYMLGAIQLEEIGDRQLADAGTVINTTVQGERCALQRAGRDVDTLSDFTSDSHFLYRVLQAFHGVFSTT
uniref:Uncharacterized protein n=1 Tax=Anopheles atroparvus TaxID=41427 RepID=A0AAG5DKG4_ANOAO